jgi:hypothetical protein
LLKTEKIKKTFRIFLFVGLLLPKMFNSSQNAAEDHLYDFNTKYIFEIKNSLFKIIFVILIHESIDIAGNLGAPGTAAGFNRGPNTAFRPIGTAAQRNAPMSSMGRNNPPMSRGAGMPQVGDYLFSPSEK